MQAHHLLLKDIPQLVHLPRHIHQPHPIGKDINNLNHGRHQYNHHHSRILGKLNILNNLVNHLNGKDNLNHMTICLGNGIISINHGIKIDLGHQVPITLLLHNLPQYIITEVV
jgi:hypothetical protein